jgi:hypothetical protein
VQYLDALNHLARLGLLAHVVAKITHERLVNPALHRVGVGEEVDDSRRHHELGGLFLQRRRALRQLGRVTGYVREFVVPQGASTLEEEPAELMMAATVVHLFDDADAVKRWIDESFVRDFRDHVGKETETGQMIQGVEILHVEGMNDYSASLLVVHELPDAVLASTIVDFRVGNLLGVAYVVAKRDVTLLDLAKELALELEKKMVRVALGAA